MIHHTKSTIDIFDLNIWTCRRIFLWPIVYDFHFKSLLNLCLQNWRDIWDSPSRNCNIRASFVLLLCISSFFLFRMSCSTRFHLCQVSFCIKIIYNFFPKTLASFQWFFLLETLKFSFLRTNEDYSSRFLLLFFFCELMLEGKKQEMIKNKVPLS